MAICRLKRVAADYKDDVNHRMPTAPGALEADSLEQKRHLQQ